MRTAELAPPALSLRAGASLTLIFALMPPLPLQNTDTLVTFNRHLGRQKVGTLTDFSFLIIAT